MSSSPTAASSPSTSQAFRKYCLINGLDDIGLTLRHKDKIKAFEAERLAQKPWLSAPVDRLSPFPLSFQNKTHENRSPAR